MWGTVETFPKFPFQQLSLAVITCTFRVLRFESRQLVLVLYLDVVPCFLPRNSRFPEYQCRCVCYISLYICFKNRSSCFPLSSSRHESSLIHNSGASYFKSPPAFLFRSLLKRLRTTEKVSGPQTELGCARACGRASAFFRK